MRGKRMIRALLAAAVLMTVTACTKREASIESADDNTIRVTATRSGESGGSGVITVAEGEHLHVEYNITKGTFDLTVAGEAYAPQELTDPEVSEEEIAEAAAENAQELVDALTADGQYKESGLSGEGVLDIAVNAGDQTLYIMLHDATGAILVTSVPAE